MGIYDQRTHDKKMTHYKSEEFVDLNVMSQNILLNGDVKFIFFDYDMVGSHEKMFHFWINTSFIKGDYLCFEKAVLDSACKDKKNKHFAPGLFPRA